MLQLKIALGPELWDEENEVFIDPEYVTLELEHSLVSLQKWESKWCKPFLHTKEFTVEEIMDYIKFMTKTPNVDPIIYEFLNESHISEIEDYIQAPMTATTFRKEDGKKSREIITAEIIYYWMITLQIPSEYRDWHINQLLTLIRVCNIKNEPKGKNKNRSERDLARYYAELNEARKKKLNTTG